MQSAPRVDSGEVSTRNAATLIEEAIAIGSPPFIFSIRPGMVGRNAGSTTPVELLYVETRPVTKAITPVTELSLEAGQQRCEQVHAPLLLKDRDEHGNATDHHNDVP